jgi:hypothetical protein
MPPGTNENTNINSDNDTLACLRRIESHLEYLRQQWEAWAPVAEAWRTSGLLAARRAMRGPATEQQPRGGWPAARFGKGQQA